SRPDRGPSPGSALPGFGQATNPICVSITSRPRDVQYVTCHVSIVVDLRSCSSTTHPEKGPMMRRRLSWLMASAMAAAMALSPVAVPAATAAATDDALAVRLANRLTGEDIAVSDA